MAAELPLLATLAETFGANKAYKLHCQDYHFRRPAKARCSLTAFFLPAYSSP